MKGANSISMDKYANALFAIIRKQIIKNDKKLNLENFADEDFNVLYKLAKRHDIAHIIGAWLRKENYHISQNILGKFSQDMMMSIYRYEQQQYELNHFVKILEEEKFEFMPLKGSVLRKYYPEPWMRTSCDIDILVRQNQVENIVKLLTEKYGYTYAIQTQHDYSLYSHSGVHIELHFILIFHDKAGDDFTEHVWESSVSEEGYLYKKKMPDDLFFTYHIAHMAQHILEGGGCGIKPFIDIVILQEKMSINVDQAQEALKRCGLVTFAQKSVELSQCWFGGEGVDETLQEFEQYVLNGGVYGTVDNKISVGASRQKGKLGYILKRLFVPYRTLRLLYPSLKKCPILFPLYQVRRWFRLLKKNGVKVSGAVRELKFVSEMDSTKKERMDKMLQELGLQ